MLELALGQILAQSGLRVWKVVPIMKCIGFGAMVIPFWIVVYYIVILSWALYSFYSSFSAILPWTRCSQRWNTHLCRTDGELYAETMECTRNMTTIANTSIDYNRANCSEKMSHYSSSVREFWELNALGISRGIEDMGGMQWHLAITLFVMWIVCYFCIWKGVKWTGKVVYFTALMPYVLLISMLIRGITLPGAGEGIRYYLMPKLDKLYESKAWIDAATQVLFSDGVAIGTLIALGSNNKYHNDVYKQAILVSLIKNGTAIFAGFVIFSVIGNMAHKENKPIDQVASSGPGLAFLAYPSAVALMPLASLWAVVFFFMIILVGIDSQFIIFEGILTGIIDEYPRLFRKRREIFLALTCVASYFVGLSCVTKGDMYAFQLMDTYASSGHERDRVEQGACDRARHSTRHASCVGCTAALLAIGRQRQHRQCRELCPGSTNHMLVHSAVEFACLGGDAVHLKAIRRLLYSQAFLELFIGDQPQTASSACSFRRPIQIQDSAVRPFSLSSLLPLRPFALECTPG